MGSEMCIRDRREVRCLSILEQMQTNIDYRIYSIKCRAQSDEWGVYSKIIRKETHFNKDMIVAVVIVINQLEINPPPSNSELQRDSNP